MPLLSQKYFPNYLPIVNTNDHLHDNLCFLFLITNIISYLDLASVYELQNMLKILQLDVGRHHHNGVRTRVLAEHHLKVGRAGTQHDLVRLDGVGGVLVHVGHHQGHVREGLSQQDLVEDGHHVALVVPPSQVEHGVGGGLVGGVVHADRVSTN